MNANIEQALQVVIPSASVENTVACCAAIIKHTALYVNIIVVDSSPNLKLMNQWHDIKRRVVESVRADGCSKELPPCGLDITAYPWLRSDKKFCFSAAVNCGVYETAYKFQTTHFIIMNDDAIVSTQFALNHIAYALTTHPGYGVMSPGIYGVADHPIIKVNSLEPMPLIVEDAGYRVPFICAAMRRETVANLSDNFADYTFMDEQFTGYGFDDDDVCRRVRLAGLKIGIFKRAIVAHGTLPSTYRTKPPEEFNALLEENRAKYLAKWGNYESVHTQF